MEAWTEVVGRKVQESQHVFWVPVEGTAPNRGEERQQEFGFVFKFLVYKRHPSGDVGRLD